MVVYVHSVQHTTTFKVRECFRRVYAIIHALIVGSALFLAPVPSMKLAKNGDPSKKKEVKQIIHHNDDLAVMRAALHRIVHKLSVGGAS